MHNRLSLGKILSCARCEYIKWIFSEKLMIVAMLGLYNYVFAVEPLLKRAELMECKVNIFEPFIAVGNSNVLLLIVPIVFLVLISDYPRLDGNMTVYISRIGRKNWAAGQMLMLIFSIATYILILIISSVLPVLGSCTVSNEWSAAVKEYAEKFPEDSMGYTLLPENLYLQMNVKETILHTITLSVLYLTVIGMIMLLAAILKHKNIGYIVSIFVIAAGTALCTMKSKLMWVMPMANAIPWLHFNKFIRREVLTLEQSYFYFFAVILILSVFVWTFAPDFDFDHIMEDQT